MRPRKSLRRQLITGLLLGCMVPYVLGGFYLKSYIESWHHKNHAENTALLLKQVSRLIDESLITPMSATVSMLSESPYVKNTVPNSPQQEQGLRLYDGRPSRSKPSLTEQALANYFASIKASYPDINFVFFATADGGYMEYPPFTPDKTYTPISRPWYIETIKNGSLTISDPYMSQVTHQLIMSFTKPVVHNGKTIGVVGISVRIIDLMSDISKIQLEDSGYLLVLNGHNRIAISPADPRWILETPKEINEPLLSKLTTEGESQLKGTLQGYEVIANQYISKKTGWKVIAIVKNEELLTQVNQITHILYGIYAVTLGIIALLVLWIVRSTTDPILSLSQVIGRIAQLEFHESDRILTKQLSHSDNETGLFAAALLDMGQKIKDTIAQLQASNQEVLTKNELLTASEEELIAQLAEIDQQKQYIQFLAFHDALTGLPNRRQFNEQLSSALANHRTGAVILLDLDNFKRINDTLGHVFGDKVLESVGEILHRFASPDIFVSRFGGDEFLVMVDATNDASLIEDTLQSLLEAFKTPLSIESHAVDVQFSMGITRYPMDSDNPDQLIMNADLSLYAVKNSTKNSYRYFDATMADQLKTKDYLEQLLKDAIAHRRFTLLYQPQIAVKDLQVSGYEALLRIEGANVSPATFIPVAEETGQIVPIGRLVAKMAIEQLVQWRQLGHELVPIAINFSAAQLHDHGFIAYLVHLLDDYKISPSLIEIEITENIFIDNKEQTLAFLNELKTYTIGISIDDFGTGYSSLSYLTFLPVDKVKLDRSLNTKFLSMTDTKVMDSLIQLAQSLNLKVVAEGIETEAQFEKLLIGGCDYIQGYYFAKPLPPEEAIHFSTH